MAKSDRMGPCDDLEWVGVELEDKSALNGIYVVFIPFLARTGYFLARAKLLENENKPKLRVQLYVEK